MLVSKEKVVSFFYTVKDDQGKILDQTDSDRPFSYIHGSNQIIPGLENAMEGKDENSKFSIHVDSNDAYGQYDENLVMKVERSFFGSEPLQKGLQLQLQAQDGYHIVTVLDFDDNEVTLDANHPLAGVNLNFDIEIKEVRDATKEELEHGHVHNHQEHEDEMEDEEDDVDDVEFQADDEEAD